MRHLATQAREPAPHYEHVDIGFNYRLSNVLAAIGRAQLADLERRVDAAPSHLRALPGGHRRAPRRGLHARGDVRTCHPVAHVHHARAGRGRATPEELRLHLEAADIEARPTWKPMHRQPVFADAPCRIDGTSDRLFATGLCLPSGSSLTDADQDRVIEAIAERLAS